MPETSAAAASRFVLRRIATDESSFASDVRAGLTAVRKSIPPRYFYDNVGSALFEAICELPEYYVSRAETEILTVYRREIAAAFGGARRIIELGCGNGKKTRFLLSEIVGEGRVLEYVPVDVDVSMLQQIGHDLLAEHADMTVKALACDFRRAWRAIREMDEVPTSVMFLGSTIGNFELEDASSMLRDVRTALRPGDTMLLGADLKKDRNLLNAAYDDPLGVTAAFNLNLLRRINRELGGEFNIREFAHRAFYDETKGRVEMHLVSLREQSVRIGSIAVEAAFSEGETIHTENSCKYDSATMERITSTGGFEIRHRWVDSNGWFAEYLLVAV